MMSKKVITVFGLCAALAGCSSLGSNSSWMPIPTMKEYAISFKSRLEQKSLGTVPSITILKTGLVDFIAEYHGYAVDKRKMEWDSSGFVTYGGIAAVLGALADKTGLLNSGAALAGLGLSNNNRYAFSQQSDVYMTAVKKLACINSKVALVPDHVFEDAKQTDDKVAADTASEAIANLIAAVDTVRIEAVNSLLAIKPSPPTRDELMALFKTYLPAAGNAAPSADPDMPRKRAAGVQIQKLLDEVVICAKL
jgi:hypothetical protein